ncbi:hypothetical protein [Streptomyces sp. SCL15-6]|uniref:hypothetical protein n=1 Tax=Streptomyces sp. SCL15-6 TaxID=2967222 RepID=UPI0029665C62|nr:hypothetical protein [Streptomyces sp. SCL15-6]
MSFEQEWAQLKADALARQAEGSMRLNQLPADSGAGVPAVSGKDLVANTDSINGNANLLVEIAGFLHEGRPDAELTTMAREPRAHGDVARQVERFAEFAGDQFLDTMALFAALSTRLRTAGGTFAAIEDETARRFLEAVLDGRYVSPGTR